MEMTPDPATGHQELRDIVIETRSDVKFIRESIVDARRLGRGMEPMTLSGEEVRALSMQIRDDLAGLGVAGSAVEVNLAAWDEWREEVEKAADVFRKNMETLKEKVKTTSGHVLKQV